MKIKKTKVKAKARKLNTKWTLESIESYLHTQEALDPNKIDDFWKIMKEDLPKNTNTSDMLYSLLSQELCKAIDQEVINEIKKIEKSSVEKLMDQINEEFRKNE